MATSLTFTSSSFAYAAQGSTAGATANQDFDLLSVNNTSDRRVYGISCTSTDAQANSLKVYVHTGSTSIQLYTVSIPINSGNTTTAAAVDVFGSTNGASIFQKQRDANGVPYFNLPAGWKLVGQYGSALGTSEVLNFITFGEVY